MFTIITSLAKEVMFLVALVCLFVCLFVDNITQKVMNTCTTSKVNCMFLQNSFVEISEQTQPYIFIVIGTYVWFPPEHPKQISHAYQTLSHWLTFCDNIFINISLGQINHMLLQLPTMNRRLGLDGFMLHSCYD